MYKYFMQRVIHPLIIYHVEDTITKHRLHGFRLLILDFIDSKFILKLTHK